MSKGKIIQSAKLYLKREGEKEMRHVTNWPTFVKVCEDLGLSTAWKDRTFLDDKNFPPKGKPITEWPEQEPEVTIRKMAIFGSVLSGCEHLGHDLLMTHIIGNGYYFGDYDLVEELGYKSIINLKPRPVGVPTEDFIKERMDAWIDRKGCGGWWIDNGIRGEEPDAQPTTSDEARKMLDDRIWFYEVVRKHDPDSLNRPVVEQFNMTEQDVIGGAYRSGWLGQYSEDPMTCDVNLWTCYVHEDTAEKMYEEQLRWYETFPGKYMKRVQLIPQISLERYWETDNDNSVAASYRNWKRIMEDRGLALGGLAYYSYLIIKDKSETHDAIREVNRKIQGE